MIKEIDIFGAGIKWRLKSQDNFKSYFGAALSSILFAMVIYKITLFAIKISDYGFAKNKILYQFKDEYQVTNFSNFRLLISSDLSYFLQKENYREKYFNNSTYINLTNYLTLKFNYDKDFSYIKLQQVPCHNRIDFVYNFTDNKRAAEFICVEFDKDYSILNVTKANAFVDNVKNDLNIYQNTIDLLNLSLEYQENLLTFLDKTKKDFRIYFQFLNYKMNKNDFSIEPFLITFSFQTVSYYYTRIEMKLRKFFSLKKVEFDIFESVLSQEDKFIIDENSYRFDKNQRRENLMTFSSLFFTYDMFQESNEITVFCLDDILSVMGGFLQLLLLIFTFLAGLYNDDLAIYEFNKYIFYKNLNNNKKITNLKVDMRRVQEFYENKIKHKHFMPTEKLNYNYHDKDIEISKNEVAQKHNLDENNEDFYLELNKSKAIGNENNPASICNLNRDENSLINIDKSKHFMTSTRMFMDSKHGNKTYFI